MGPWWVWVREMASCLDRETGRERDRGRLAGKDEGGGAEIK